MTIKWRKPPGGLRRLSESSVSVDTLFYDEDKFIDISGALQAPYSMRAAEPPAERRAILLLGSLAVPIARTVSGW